jgi:hypothetical protein
MDLSTSFVKVDVNAEIDSDSSVATVLNSLSSSRNNDGDSALSDSSSINAKYEEPSRNTDSASEEVEEAMLLEALATITTGSSSSSPQLFIASPATDNEAAHHSSKAKLKFLKTLPRVDLDIGRSQENV